MTERFHTIVIGGGILGCSCAIALARKLGPRGRVCIVDKAIVGAGLSSRHSGIVRAADGSPAGAGMAVRAAETWTNLETVWGVGIPFDRTGALWIAPSTTDAATQWEGLAAHLAGVGVDMHRLDHEEAAAMAGAGIRLNESELGFFEPGALSLNPSDILKATHDGIRINGIDLKERTEVTGFETEGGRIIRVKTSRGDLQPEFVVNAAGGWAPQMFGPLGLSIPVALIPTYVAHWLVSPSEMGAPIPIVCDVVDKICFRRWHGGRIRMHQIRDRRSSTIARTFSEKSSASASADIIFESSNYFSHHGLVHRYQEQLRRRFPKIGQPIFSGGFVAYYEITPDLRFILGPDPQLPNLMHCLGAGVGLKFAPLLGTLISEAVLSGRVPEELAEFSIARFHGRPAEEFWEAEE